MVVAEVVGVGIFLTPATMMRTLGGTRAALTLWLAMGAFSIAGALCYAELSTRYPRAGGPYVFLREAYGRRIAFLYGWMSLLVVDPGLTAALGIGFAQYLLATVGASAGFLVPTAVGTIVVFGLLTLTGLAASARVMRATAIAKLAMVGVLVLAALAHGGHTATAATSVPPLQFGVLAPAIVAAFFAFGGWWDLGKMSEDVVEPGRTMPRALIGGVALVALIYALVTVAFMRDASASGATTDEALVRAVGTALFGGSASRLLAAMVTVAVAGSLAAVLLGAPRVYVAMARDRLFPLRLAHVDERRGIPIGATLVQVALASLLVLFGTFNEILGYFVPAAVFFLGLSAAAILVLPRPADGTQSSSSRDRRRAFRAPLHPLPILVFLVLIVVMLVLFVGGQPRQTLIGAVVIALGLPVSGFVIHRR